MMKADDFTGRAKAERLDCATRCARCCTARVAAIICAVVAVTITLLWCLVPTYIVSGILLDTRVCAAISNSPERIETGADYSSCERYAKVDLSKYEIADRDEWEHVSFDARGGDVKGLRAWWFSPNKASGPTVIMVHGTNSCKNRYEVALPATMLADRGFNVLALDLRNQGESPDTNGYQTIGVYEHLDVLGAADWLREEKRVDWARIGLWGASQGTTAVLHALRAESKLGLGGVMLDSPPYGMLRAWEEGVREQTGGILPWSIILHFLQTRTGVDMVANDTPNVLPAIAAVPGRRPRHVKLLVVGGKEDKRVTHAQHVALADHARALGFDVDTWFSSTIAAHSWGGNHFGARPSDTTCREHITQMLVRPGVYAQRLTAHFARALDLDI
mmetsp:Transcript_23109/g.59378  ORF Transcript_23109/g.59378 Transcript_23109/m.59378 type:complete len:389 (-) Transcript_23109:277-1443(-)